MPNKTQSPSIPRREARTIKMAGLYSKQWYQHSMHLGARRKRQLTAQWQRTLRKEIQLSKILHTKNKNKPNFRKQVREAGWDKESPGTVAECGHGTDEQRVSWYSGRVRTWYRWAKAQGQERRRLKADRGQITKSEEISEDHEAGV